MKNNEIFIGIDSGSTAASAAAMDSSGEILAVGYAFHQGRVTECLRGLLGGLLPEGEAAQVSGVARTTSAPGLGFGPRAALEIDGRVAEIKAARRFHPECRSLIVVGAEKFARITFDEEGRYRSMRGNSSCAAGTGSFLDQQSSRLGLKRGSAELAERALANSGERPSIASRCSVFAKTDLIHAQQEGWTVEEICDGLSEGLARNIADTLFPGERPAAPIFMAGGVSRNAAVLRHLSALAGSPIATDGYSHVYGAIGACLALVEAREAGGQGWEGTKNAVGDIALDAPPEREYANEALPGPSAGYPDFASARRFLFAAKRTGPSNPVEVDVYLDAAGMASLAGAAQGAAPCATAELPVLLGLDIGSTSTKAALVSPSGEVLAGLYTRTAGRPLEATQGIFEAIEGLEADYGLRFKVLLSATTGSGRKLVGSVIGADETIDEITAHARAAVDLDPSVDTIIEIGGQDSKFTLLKNGIVTFSQMNAVCAAGTGSFLEEQAARLGVPLSEFAERAIGQRAPLTSDRCTVFMERDLNHFQSLGYSTDELLAASLYSVCDNYLGKVAQRGSIGDRVAFQGATAKNRALVAVFEKRLGKKIAVSRFCHLTGAIGSALQARDEVRKEATSFRGFGIWKLELPSRAERCGLCANDCRLRVIDVGGEEVAYGFLCGRDYGTKHFVGGDANRHNYLPRRKKAIEAAYAQVGSRAHNLPGARADAPALPTIGIPSALYMEEDAPFWTAFFGRLGFACVAAPDDSGALRTGKRLAGAEFCAPMALLHGQVHALLESADYVFLPTYLEDRPERRDGREARRYYCNYSEYASAVARCAEHADRERILSPLLVGRFGDTSRAMDEMEAALGAALRGGPRARGAACPSRRDMDAAYAACVEARGEARAGVKALFKEGEEPAVVLIGRPYAVLSEAMGKGIADMIAKRGMDVLYADMLPEAALEEETDIEPLLAAFHWRYATEVLKAARYCAASERCYPVFVTSFKCSPDAFAIEWFKRILDAAGKPYLILQIDEHDSSVGYETRVEAGLRSFRNHFRAKGGERSSGASAAFPVNPSTGRELKGKVVLFPNWDPLVSPLLAANLRGCGIDARPLEESSGSIRRAMGSNTGQCIPINIIARDCAEYVERNHLDPSSVVLWIAAGLWPCNLPLYPHYMKSVLEHQGGGMEKIEVYNGDIFFLYVGFRAMLGTYHAFLAGGTLRKLACRTRPYEVVKGETDRLVREGLEILIEAFEKGGSKAEAYEKVFGPFARVRTEGKARPKVAIFGDLYARDNDVLNQDLIRTIEASGGEAVVTPYLDYVKAVLDAHLNRLILDRDYGEWVRTKAAVAVVRRVEKALVRRSSRVLEPPRSWGNPGFAGKVARFGLRPEQEGECFDNAVKIFKILEEHPDVSLFVQTNPAFCCPSIVSQALTGEIERVTGVPVVTINYDGTGAFKNDALVPFLALGGTGSRRESESRELAPAAEH